MSMSRVEYKMKKDIAALVLKCDGTLFGGYVRDTILHNFWADKFYDTPGVDTSRYHDLTYLPETKDRLVVGSDIDVMIHSDKVTDFFSELTKNQYTIVKHKSSTLGYTFKDDARLMGVKHDKIIVAPSVHPLMKSLTPIITVEIDLVHSNNYTEDMMSLDFQCNGVIITSNGDFSIHPALVSNNDPFVKKRMLDHIMSDISNRIAVKVNQVMPYRVDKMLKKGWILKGEYLEAQKYTSDGTEHCALCLDAFKNNVAVRGLCCKGRLHQKCFKKLIQHDRTSCIYCCAYMDTEVTDVEFLG